MLLRTLRIIAALAAPAFAVAAYARPNMRIEFALLAAEMLVFAFALHLYRHDLERSVALRYLSRSKTSKTLKIAWLLCAAVLLMGLGLFLGGHENSRTLETMGAFMLFGGGLAVALVSLLSLFSIFTAVSTLGVALGVASLVVVLSVTSGFESEFQDKVLAVNGHLIATAYGNPEPHEAEREAKHMMEKLAILPGLTRMERFSLSAGDVMIGKHGALLKGVDMKRGAREIERAVSQGKFSDLNKPATCRPPAVLPGEEPGPAEEAGRMLLGMELAHKLRAKVGDCVSVLVPFASARDVTPPSFRFKVVGIFHLGFNEYDSHLAYVNLDDAKNIAAARHTMFGVEMRFEDPISALRLLPQAETILGPQYRIMDWRTLNANLFRALVMQKVVISIVLLIIIVVAAFNILASLYLIVLTKVREIAILGSMGARKRAILGIFLVAGTTVGAVGGVLGLALGVGICAIVSRFGYALDPKVYLIERLPVEISSIELLSVPAVAMTICLLATLYPAMKASRLRTVDGLRGD